MHVLSMLTPRNSCLVAPKINAESGSRPERDWYSVSTSGTIQGHRSNVPS